MKYTSSEAAGRRAECPRCDGSLKEPVETLAIDTATSVAVFWLDRASGTTDKKDKVFVEPLLGAENSRGHE